MTPFENFINSDLFSTILLNEENKSDLDIALILTNQIFLLENGKNCNLNELKLSIAYFISKNFKSIENSLNKSKCK